MNQIVQLKQIPALFD